MLPRSNHGFCKISEIFGGKKKGKTMPRHIIEYPFYDCCTLYIPVTTVICWCSLRFLLFGEFSGIQDHQDHHFSMSGNWAHTLNVTTQSLFWKASL